MTEGSERVLILGGGGGEGGGRGFVWVRMHLSGTSVGGGGGVERWVCGGGWGGGV